MTNPISSIVSVTARVADAVAPEVEFGATLLVTDDDSVLAAGGASRLGRYAGITDVSTAGFGTGSGVYKAAAAYFEQIPYPKDLRVARWNRTEEQAEIVGGTPSALATVRAEGATATIKYIDSDITDPDIVAAATATLSGTSVGALHLRSMGDGYSSAPTVTIASPSSGTAAKARATLGSGADGDKVVSLEIVAGVNSIRIDEGGDGYTGSVTCTTTDPSGGSVNLTATLDAGGGIASIATTPLASYSYSAPVAITIPAPTGTGTKVQASATMVLDTLGGSGYSTAPKVTIGSPGTETEVTVDVSAISSLDDVAETFNEEAGSGSQIPVMRYDAANGNFVVQGQVNRAISIARTDLGDAIGLSPDVYEYHDGVAEDVGAFFADVVKEDAGFHWIILEDSISTDIPTAVQFAEWAAANGKQFIYNSGDRLAISNPAASSLVQSDLITNERESTVVIYDPFNEALDARIAGVMSAVDFDQSLSLRTLKFVELRGARPVALTPTQRNNLEKSNINYFTTVGNRNIVMQGVSVRAGSFPDTTYWLAWFTNSLQNTIMNVLVNANRIGNNPAGIGVLRSAITNVCDQGVRNGGISAGNISERLSAEIRKVTGDASFAGFLRTGYRVYFSPLASLTASSQGSRKAPPARVWVKFNSAIHSVDIDVLLV